MARMVEEAGNKALRRLLVITTLLAVSGSLLYVAGAALWAAPGGLQHSVSWRDEGDPYSFTGARASGVELSFLDRLDDAPTVRFRADWNGFVHIHETGSYEVLLRADNGASVTIDGDPVVAHEAGTSEAWAEKSTVRLVAGLHALEVSYRQGRGVPVLDLRLGPAGEPLPRINPDDLYPENMDPDGLARVEMVRRARRIATWLWLPAVIAGLLLLLQNAVAGRALARRLLPTLTLAAYVLLLFRWFNDPGLAGEGGMRSTTQWPLVVLLIVLATGSAIAQRMRLHTLRIEWLEAWRANRRDAALLGVVLAVSFLFQLPMMLYPAGVLHSDAAINGLMAMHISAGRVAPAFYYGQQFMGTLFSHTLALLFVITGPFTAGLTLLSWVFYAGFLAAIYFMVRQASGPGVGFIVALWLAIPPVALLVTLPQTEYPQLLLLSSWALALVGARLAGLLRQEVWWVVAGAFLGLAFWGHAFAIFVVGAVACSQLALLSLRVFVRAAGLLALGFVLGVLPGLVGWGSNLDVFLEWFLAGGGRGGDAMFMEALGGLVSVSLGNLLLGTVGEIELSAWISLPLAGVVLVAIAWSGIMALRYRWRHANKTDQGSGSELRCLAVALPLAFFLLFHLTPLLSRNAFALIPRQYLVPLYLGVPALVAIFIYAILQARSRLATPITIAVVGVWACIPLPASIGLMRSLPGMEASMEESIIALRGHGVDHCVGPYWDAYRLSYLTLEEIVCESVRVHRVPHYPEAVGQRGNVRASVFVAAPSRASLPEREASLRARGVVFSRIETREFVALVQLR